MSRFRFDVSKLTAREIMVYNQANLTGDIERMAVILAQTCIECPQDWGDNVTADAFENTDYGTYLEAAADFQRGTEAAAEAAGTGDYTFTAEFRQIKAKDVGRRLLRPMATGNIPELVKFLTEIVKDCPKAWGKPNQDETWMQLPYYNTFLPFLRQLALEARTPPKLQN